MTRRLPFSIMVLLIGLLTFAAGCGLSLDDAPREIATDDLPAGLRPGQLPTPVPDVPAATGRVGNEQIFMVAAGNKLVGVTREIVETPLQIMETLFLGTFPEEALDGVTTAITRESQVRDIQLNDLFLLATVDLAPGSLDARNSEQKLAFAQIIFSLTSLPTVESVQFVQTDPAEPGQGAVPIAVQTDTGTTLPGQRVGRADFALLDPNIGPTIGFEPDIPTPVPTAVGDADQAPRFEQFIWKVDEFDHLIRVVRELEFSQEALLVGLFTGASVEERERLIRSAIPPDALANSVETRSFDVVTTNDQGVEIAAIVNIAFVDLAPGSLPSANDDKERILAAAQIVYTLTELAQIDQVTFSVDGVAAPTLTENGLSSPFDNENPAGLSREDFDTLLSPALAPAPTPSPEPTAAAETEPAPTAAPEPTAEAAPAVSPSPTPGS